MKTRLLSILLGITLGLSVGIIAQGPATNALNLKVRTDANNYLISTGFAYTAPDGPATSLANIKLKTDANGYLITTNSSAATTNFFYAADGAIGTPSITFSSDTTLGLYKPAANFIGFASGGTVRFAFNGAAGPVIASNMSYGFSSTTAATGAVDTQIARVAAGELNYTPVAFAALGTPANGTINVYCSDCTVATAATCPATAASCTCAGSGTGAIANRLNGVWDCRNFR